MITSYVVLVIVEGQEPKAYTVKAHDLTDAFEMASEMFHSEHWIGEKGYKLWCNGFEMEVK